MSDALTPHPAPKVSVAIITYNHVRFIRQAVESVAAQQTNFPYEIVVGEDVSTDGTREAVIELQQRFPDKVRALLHEKNLGMRGNGNFVATLTACRGEYVCYLEGDDYWVDPGKLQRQVEFMEANRDCSACIHDVRMLMLSGEVKGLLLGYAPGTVRIGLTEMFHDGFPHLMTMMYRRALVTGFPDWFYKLAMGDWAFFSMLASHGPIGFIRDWPAGMYRIHGTSYWLGRPFVDRSIAEIEAFKTLMEVFGPKYHDCLKWRMNRHEFWLTLAYHEKGEVANARATLRVALRNWMRYRSISARQVANIVLTVEMPGLLRFFRRVRSWFGPGRP